MVRIVAARRALSAVALAGIALGCARSSGPGPQALSPRPCAEECDRQRRSCEGDCTPEAEDDNRCADRCASRLAMCQSTCR